MLVAIYVPERVSNAARHAVRAVRQILFTQMRELEVCNACELLVGRDLITTDECRAMRAQLDGDLDSQRLVQVSGSGSSIRASRL